MGVVQYGLLRKLNLRKTDDKTSLGSKKDSLPYLNHVWFVSDTDDVLLSGSLLVKIKPPTHSRFRQIVFS